MKDEAFFSNELKPKNMKKVKFYEIIIDGTVRSIWAINQKSRIVIGYDLVNQTKYIFSSEEDLHEVLLDKILETEIDEKEFEYFLNFYISDVNDEPTNEVENEEKLFKQARSDEFNDRQYDALDVDAPQYNQPRPKKVFKPISKYQLYNSQGSIEIYGYSKKTTKELVDFFEATGRTNGFRILNSKGQTTGFVNAELFNSLSYHVKQI